MTKEKVCRKCGRSEGIQKILPRWCNHYEEHDFQPERICTCGHGESNHLLRHGMMQCSTGECFPYSKIKHNLNLEYL